VPALVAAGYHVIAMDNRGHGRSTWDGSPLSYELMASDVLGLLDYLGIKQTALVGWSDGGIIGLELAIHHPERLTKVVAYGANFTVDGTHDPTPTPALDADFAKRVAQYQRLSPQPERWDEFLTALLQLWSTEPNYTDEQLASITTPFLILDGAEEEFVNPDQPVRMAALIPGAELVIMPGVGHFAMFAQSAVFNQIVLDFLAS